MQRHPRRTDIEKQNLVKAWEQSKENMPAFCKEHDISISSLKIWQGKFGASKKSRIKKSDFVALEVAAPAFEQMQSPYAELHFDNGSRLLLHHPVTSAYLRELLY